MTCLRFGVAAQQRMVLLKHLFLASYAEGWSYEDLELVSSLRLEGVAVDSKQAASPFRGYGAEESVQQVRGVNLEGSQGRSSGWLVANHCLTSFSL